MKGSSDRGALHEALAEAGSATWDLALAASEPAARISRDMLNATTQDDQIVPEAPSDRPRTSSAGSDTGLNPVASGFPVSVLSFVPLTPDPAAASEVLQGVGDHFAAGVRPLSSTARHAFSFLFGPARDQAGPQTSPRAAKGA
jgi:hypothetical protein